jgi:hypothetical protein
MAGRDIFIALGMRSYRKGHGNHAGGLKTEGIAYHTKVVCMQERVPPCLPAGRRKALPISQLALGLGTLMRVISDTVHWQGAEKSFFAACSKRTRCKALKS